MDSSQYKAHICYDIEEERETSTKSMKKQVGQKNLPLFEARQAQQWQQYIYIGYTDVCTKIAS
jgi:hypothetical protein